MTKIDEDFSFLFSRLTWPSVLVRERACSAIADLLSDSKLTKTVQGYLINWMKAQTLESITAIGLLIFLRAKMQNDNFEIPSVRELLSANPKQSILSLMIMNELVSDNIPDPDWSDLNNGEIPDNFETDPRFIKRCQSFLPRIYMHSAEYISDKTSFPFVKQWAYESLNILERINKEPSDEPLYFWGNENSDHYITLDFELSEVYRSAYLRTLTRTIMVGALSISDAKYFTLKTSPIDLGLWRLKPNLPPFWWPKIDIPKADNIPPLIWKKVEALWEKQMNNEDKWIVAEAGGRVNGNTNIYDLEICGLFKTCLGPSAPNLDDLVNWYRQIDTIQHDAYGLVFKGSLGQVSPGFLNKTFSDWIMSPAAYRIHPHTVPRWQFWRMYRGIWLPAPFICSNPLTFRCSDNAVIVEDGKEIIGKWMDWTDGLSEKQTANIPLATGQYLILQRQNVETFIRDNDLEFCWVCRLTGYHQEHSYEPYKQFVDYRQFRTSSVSDTAS